MYVHGTRMPAAARKKRTARFNVRVSDKEAELIRLGAERRGVNITNFILESACVRAEQEIADARHFKISSQDWQKFSEALDRPAKMKPKLKRLLAESTVLEQS
jgi:uncharacterized protein (DUF1778 family)